MSVRDELKDLATEVHALPRWRRLLFGVSGAATFAFLAWWILQASGAVGSGDPADALRRSVEKLTPVARARVQLGGESDGESPRSAVLLIEPRVGEWLSPMQIEGIRRLAAAHVPGLVASNVSVLDGSGLPFGDGEVGGTPEVAAGPPDWNPVRQRGVERDLAERAQSLLERAVGTDRVAVRVRADLDWSRREETKESFDPAGQVERSEERSVTPGRADAAVERVEYDNGKSTTREITPGGEIERLHVAVLLEDPAATAGDGGSWSAEELSRFEALAKRAVGFSAERGDAFTLATMPQHAQTLGIVVPGWLWDVAPIGAALLLAAACFVFWLRRGTAESLDALGLPRATGELEASLVGAGGWVPPKDATQEDLIARSLEQGAEQDAAASTLRAWLRER